MLLLPAIVIADNFQYHAYVDKYTDTCGRYGGIYLHAQAVGVLNYPGENAKFTFKVPSGATKAYFFAKSHAPRPSMAFSKTNYADICWAGRCDPNKITVAVNLGDTLAAVNKSYVQKHLELNGSEKFVYVYWANIGKNFGTSSMFDAKIIFKMTDKACENLRK